MAEIQIKVTVPDGAKCEDPQYRWACKYFGNNDAEYCDLFKKYVGETKLPQCITATILPDKAPNECEVCGRPKSADCCGFTELR